MLMRILFEVHSLRRPSITWWPVWLQAVVIPAKLTIPSLPTLSDILLVLDGGNGALHYMNNYSQTEYAGSCAHCSTFRLWQFVGEKNVGIYTTTAVPRTFSVPRERVNLISRTTHKPRIGGNPQGNDVIVGEQDDAALMLPDSFGSSPCTSEARLSYTLLLSTDLRARPPVDIERFFAFLFALFGVSYIYLSLQD